MGLIPCWGTGRVRRDFPLSEEGAAEMTTAPILCATEGRGDKEFGSEVEPEKRGGEGKMFLIFSFYFSSSYSDLIGNKFN